MAAVRDTCRTLAHRSTLFNTAGTTRTWIMGSIGFLAMGQVYQVDTR